MVIPTTDALVTRLQQMFMLVDHAKAEVTIHCYDELRERHLTIFAFCRLSKSSQNSACSSSLKVFEAIFLRISSNSCIFVTCKSGATPSHQKFIDNHPDDYEFARNLPYDKFVKEHADKDQLVDDKKQSEDEESKTGSKRSELVKHLMNIERCIQLYQSKNIAEFIAKTEYNVLKAQDKRDLADIMNTLSEPGDKTIGEILVVCKV